MRSSTGSPSRRRGDERGQRLGNGQGGQIADRPIDAILEREPAFGEEHPDGLDRVQGHPIRSLDDRLDGAAGQAGNEPGEELAHRRLGQRLEIERGEVALAGAPVRALLEELRAGQRDHEDRDVAAPLHDVVDEVDEADIGKVEVLEDHHDRGRGREAFEERPPGGEELLRAGVRCLDPQERQQAGLDPASLAFVDDMDRQRLGHLCPGRRWVVRFDAGPQRSRTISPSAQKLIPSP